MRIFVAAPYSSQVNYETGEIFREYQDWLENILVTIEGLGHSIYNAIRADPYRINDTDPAAAFRLDITEIGNCDVLIAVLDGLPSVGVQTEVGVAVAMKKKVVIAHAPESHLAFFNAAMVQAGVARELVLPLTKENITIALSETPQPS